MGKSTYHIKETKTEYKFSYTGDLTEALAKAERDLTTALNDPNIEKWIWIKDTAEKAIKANSGRIKRLQAFIGAAKRQLEKEKEEKHDKNT
jgi:hypothetical protein